MLLNPDKMENTSYCSRNMRNVTVSTHGRGILMSMERETLEQEEIMDLVRYSEVNRCFNSVILREIDRMTMMISLMYSRNKHLP
mgnify:CR=1 FL=1